ncbi:unnamed protein product [Effrenium voratum]|nr:unnamed protein product [Effrenium voratum]CAJ1392580.1 unnamed protein product [Effrenium voratum]CAJ1422964.1 unnamed protein product [Effrenium voratum]|mmetsp:Transcript_125354/g.297581  ORF Transcript_125354/g.297581 Transcript_125354/m.297581 type:complete len:316 (-) Transcript_125354:81-1028(-)|eukprot:CAMPEP_0181430794 /NCGR_PEP_ID=MMETSP1110-20121109/17907_1 /TAXON_ID=174948 /ORGANISM="Symbiodinium sp., Strain CCMP421" /LENGTH=315 /DNA_ID=CAMNT_0023554121 /DNA_START=71 /DNA_END=1018 /DNA_ORIENTATION=-
MASDSSQIVVSVASWCVCSVGMMVFNKVAVSFFPAECFLVALQMAVACFALLAFAWRTIHIGSLYDVMRWMMVIPFFSGMLLTSMLALKNAPMSLVVVLRCLSPIAGLAVESFYPKPIQVSAGMLGSIFIMLAGSALYASRMPHHQLAGAGWALLNSGFAVGDRLLQRLMLAADQKPVDISKTGVTLLNNLAGMVPVLVCAAATQEWNELPHLSDLSLTAYLWIAASCVVGVGISYTGIWCQSLISATGFLILINVNKFAIIIIEALWMSKELTWAQVVGAVITVFGGVTYGKAQEALAEKEKDSEKEPLVAQTA